MAKACPVDSKMYQLWHGTWGFKTLLQVRQGLGVKVTGGQEAEPGHLQLFSRRSNGWQSTISTSYLTPNSRGTFGGPTKGRMRLTGNRPRRQDMAWHSLDRCFVMSSPEDLHALVLSDVKPFDVFSLNNESWLCFSAQPLSRRNYVRLVPHRVFNLSLKWHSAS